MKLILKPCPPIKDADFKVTLSTNKPAVSLLDLFPEFALDAGMANAAGFRYHCGPVVTVLSSKTSQRYRLQSDNLPSLWILTREIEARLRKAHAQSQPPLQCGYSSSLPMHEYFLEVETRFRRRQRLGALRAQLARCAAQFRAIERRLLSRFKDRTPSALTNLDTLLEGTYRQIAAAADAAEECRAELESSSCNLSCITGLLLLLSRLSTGASEEDAAMLASALSPVIQEGAAGLGEDGVGGHGWEETTDAALTFLLRTSLAKAGRENQGATPITLEAPKDTVRLKKHVSSVMDRVAKGGKISDGRNAVAATALLDLNPVDDDDDGETTATDQLPAGSKFGEAGERLRSARARSARIGAGSKTAGMTVATAVNSSGNDDYADVEGDIREEEGGDEEEGEDEVDETKDADELIGW